jgi:hypothetical protein
MALLMGCRSRQSTSLVSLVILAQNALLATCEPVDPACLRAAAHENNRECESVLHAGLKAVATLNSRYQDGLQMELVRVVEGESRAGDNHQVQFTITIIACQTDCQNNGPFDIPSTHYAGQASNQCSADERTLSQYDAVIDWVPIRKEFSTVSVREASEEEVEEDKAIPVSAPQQAHHAVGFILFIIFGILLCAGIGEMVNPQQDSSYKATSASNWDDLDVEDYKRRVSEKYNIPTEGYQENSENIACKFAV